MEQLAMTRLFVDADETGDAAVVGSLHLGREQAAGQLAKSFVVHDALAAQPLAAARLVGASAFGQVFLLVTFFHDVTPIFQGDLPGSP